MIMTRARATLITPCFTRKQMPYEPVIVYLIALIVAIRDGLVPLVEVLQTFILADFYLFP